jgi:hypothetical protein
MCEQSALVAQGLQVPLLQKEATGLLQSVELRHSTQVFLTVSQRGVLPPQLPLPVHCTQRLVAVLQACVVLPQLTLTVHCAQVYVAILHAGVGAVQ